MTVTVHQPRLSEPLPYEVEACEGDDRACDEDIGILCTRNGQEVRGTSELNRTRTFAVRSIL
jgi:hypothetical protein